MLLDHYPTLRKRLPLVIRWSALILLVALGSLIVTTIIKRSRRVQTPPPVRAAPLLSDTVVSITEGYRYTTTEQGKPKFQLSAARDTSFADGRHELEKIDLISYGSEGKEQLRVVADRGVYRPNETVVALNGNVRVKSVDGLEVASDVLHYNQRDDVASSDVLVKFTRAALSGSSIGAILYAKTKTLALMKDAVVINSSPPSQGKGGQHPPVEVRSGRADYFEHDGIIKFTGDTVVRQGPQVARADSITGVFKPETRDVDRIEFRGKSSLRDEEPGRVSTLEARDIDMFFNENQSLQRAVAAGSARATSVEKEAPRELTAERLEAIYRAREGQKSGKREQESLLQSINSQGRTNVRLRPAPQDAKAKDAEAQDFEADSVETRFREDGKNLEEVRAAGNVILTITPLVVGPKSDRTRVTGPQVKADFYTTGNVIKSFVAEGGAEAHAQPLDPKTKRPSRTLAGKKITGKVHEPTREVSDLLIEGDVKFTEGERRGTAARAIYTSANQMVALRGKPLIWDEASRSDADEIDASLEDSVTYARGRVRTTYYSREATGDAAPFKKSKAPVFVTSDQAVIRHNENVARFTGDARTWQDDNFITAPAIELDRNEKMLQAWDGVQSALYSVEREVEKGRKELVPIFASANKMNYREATRTVHYEGKVKLRQGTDQIEAAVADALMDEKNQLTQLTGERDVVLTQPQKRGTGDRLEYQVAKEVAILSGKEAQIIDNERGITTKGAKLTLHLRDARIQVNDESGGKRVRTTHRIQR